MYQVVDAKGRVIELDDDEIVPPGCNLHVPATALFLDSAQRRVARDTEQRLRVLDAYLDMKDRVSRGMRRHRVVTPDEDVADGDDPRAVAYSRMKQRLGAPKKRKPVEHHGWRI